MELVPLETRPLPLTNDGRLELFFLGVGSAFTKRQYQTNLLIVKGDEHVMVDFGTRAPHALHELGRRVTDIRTFLITHSHADHIGGLEEVALMGRYVSHSKPTMWITKEYQSYLWSRSMRGGCAPNEPRGLSFRDFFTIRRPAPLRGYGRDAYECRIGGLTLTLLRTRHIPEGARSWRNAIWSTAVLIDDRVLFTSDTLLDRRLLEAVDLRSPLEAIFHDCQFFTGGVHAGLDELAALPAGLKRRMVLVHYGDNWEQFEGRVLAEGFVGLGKQWVHYRF